MWTLDQGQTQQTMGLDYEHMIKADRHLLKEELQTVNKYMKKFSASLGIREMQIETTLRFHPLQLKWRL
jgi:hypothetical protein